ncbi:MAG: ATP-binding protein [Gammaproteobacteria bacterium]|nr:ATP-binding protein [Gammaproteobacteria bacterium]MDH3465456.1 ATP-binding protein [Gammaproteobacteria bacterium]
MMNSVGAMAIQSRWDTAASNQCDAKPGAEKRSFNLLHWYAVLSFICIVLISSISAVLLSRFLTNQILQRDAIVTTEFIEKAVQQANAVHLREPPADHIHAAVSEDHPLGALDHFLAGHREPLQGHAHTPDAGLSEFFGLLWEIPSVLRANVYRSDGLIVWSSNRKLVGRRFLDNHELQGAFSGELIAHQNRAEAAGKPEHVEAPLAGRFIENYLPIWGGDKANVRAVVEIYKSPMTLFAAIDRGQQFVWVAAGTGGLFLYLSLFWIMRRANTTIRQQQKQLVESETLTAIGEMASAVAHGFRNPLASLRTSAELALDDGSLNAAHESLIDVTDEVDRLEKWVRDLLTYSRPANGHTEKLQVNDVVSSCMLGFTEQIDRQNICIAEGNAEDLPTVRASAAALSQVFNSLIANALEAMPGGGQLAVTTCLTPDRRNVEVSISDTGSGIRDGDMHKLFQPFFTTKRTGLGVGLSLAKRIIERIDGSIEVKSEHGRGTTMTVRVPAPR